jgi:S-adenosylmethionine hydrolase
VTRPIVFLSDYGLEDEFVGVCRGVIAGIAPDARVIDLTHGVPGQDVLRGAALLAQTARFMPDDAVFLAIVDPDVGTARIPLAVQAVGGAILVGPDNGILSLAWDELGGPSRAVEIRSERYVLAPPSPTFHGRDVFAPAAAHLSTGVPLEELGPERGVDSLLRLRVPEPGVDDGEIACEVFAVDRFGNLQLSARDADLGRARLDDATELEVTAEWGTWRVARVATFADVGPHDLALVVDSAGFLALIVNEGSAALALGLRRGDAVGITALR